MVTNSTKVFVVDDDQDMRQSLQWLIESVGLSVEAFESAEQFQQRYRGGEPGCLLLDVRMPGMGGLRLLEQLQLAGSRLPVIMLTGHGDVAMAVKALKSGAFDFIEKPAPHQQLLDRIKDALALDHHWRARERDRANLEKLFAKLSQRERDVLEQLVAGMSNKAIALELGISERTVEKHRENLMHKTGARSLAELIRAVVIFEVDRTNQ